ncbi:MAG TPA: hypothetical protein V6D23_26495, partial [Candidatus Obscuribacterales bacterium]
QQLEARAESIRLAYVALTRAREKCYLAWVWLKESPRAKENRCAWSALGCLLGLSGAALGEDVMFQRLQAQTGNSLSLRTLPGQAKAVKAPPIEVPSPVTAPASFTPKIPATWRLNSFSSLQARLPEISPLNQINQLSQSNQLPVAQLTEIEKDASEGAEQLPQLPGGSRVGSFLHQLLQNVNFRADREAVADLILRQLPACPVLRGWEEPLQELILTTLQIPLDPDLPGLQLAALDQYHRETPFYFPQTAQRDGQLARLLAAHGLLPDDPVPELSMAPGLMTGRLDLVFAWQERYYVLDYKSSFLGLNPEDYRPIQLETALKASGQLLQGLLYSVALHRSLALRLQNYDPQHHLGGVYYLFLRGLDLAAGPEQGIWKMPADPGLVAALSEQLEASA